MAVTFYDVTFYEGCIKGDADRDPEVIRALERVEKAKAALLDAQQAYQNTHLRVITRLYRAWEAAEPHGKP